jgi:RND family efflux transporter MFP subunit
MVKNKRFVIAGAAAAALIAAGSVAYLAGAFKDSDASAATADASAQQGPPPAVVQVSEAVQAELAPLSEAPGSVVSLRDSLIAAETSGKIVWVANVGVELDEGGVIARLDSADAKFARDEAAADVRRLTSRSEYLDKLYERYEGLGEESGESEATLDSMKADREDARANLARARSALERAETNLARTEVKAPFAGRVVAQQAQIGEYAQPGAPIARVVDTHNLEVTAQAPAALLKSVKPGDEITLAHGAETMKASIRAVVPVGDEISRTLEIRIALPETTWNIGSAVRVSLPTTEPKTVVAAHRDALVLRSDSVSVYVIGDDMKAKRVEVELGAAEGELIEVIGDVQPGDKLVIRGGERLRDGQAVTISQGLVAGATASGLPS